MLVGVSVGVSVGVGVSVLVGNGVFVRLGVAIGLGVKPQADIAKPNDAVLLNFRKSRRDN